MNIDEKITKLCRTHLDMVLSDAAERKIQSTVNSELDKARSFDPKPIMTMSEIAAYLGVDTCDVEENLGDIPCFEFAGKLRFRKEAVDRWIERKEQLYAYEINSSRQKEGRKLFIV